MSCKDEFKLINFYNVMDKKFTQKSIEYPSFSSIRIELPARLLFVGASGTGKTSVLLNFIKGIGVWSEVHLYAKDLSEPLYEYLIDISKTIEKKIKKQWLFTSNTIDDLPDIETFDKKENRLIIFDDFINENPKKLAKLFDLYTMGRKRNITTVFLSQSYYGTPKRIRDNLSHLILKSICGRRDLTSILKDSGSSLQPEQLQRMYEHAIHGSFLNFFMIDMSNYANQHPEYKYRKNFTPIKI